MQSQGNTSYTYDGNGRLSQKTSGSDVTTYDYDSQGRLKQVQTPDHTIEYRHNALGNRVAKVKDGAVVERYLWQDKTTLLATYDGNGNLKQRFEYTLGHAPTSFTENGNTYYLLTDQLGSPRVITESSGQVVKAVEYDAYGNVISDSNPTITIPFGFAGGLKDSDTGLIRFGYRDYDPKTGRWTARDPIGFAGGDTNLYGYVLGDPVNWIDPRGENPFAIAGAIIGAGMNAIANYSAYATGQISGADYAKSIAVGGLTGALSGFGAGFVGNVVAGAASSAANTGINNLIVPAQECNRGSNVNQAAGAGAAAGAITATGEAAGSMFSRPVLNVPIQKAGKSFSGVGGAVGFAIGTAVGIAAGP